MWVRRKTSGTVVMLVVIALVGCGTGGGGSTTGTGGQHSAGGNAGASPSGGAASGGNSAQGGLAGGVAGQAGRVGDGGASASAGAAGTRGVAGGAGELGGSVGAGGGAGTSDHGGVGGSGRGSAGASGTGSGGTGGNAGNIGKAGAGGHGGGSAGASSGGGGGAGGATSFCGDGILESGESCDTAIAVGKSGACPTSCPFLDYCVPRQLTIANCVVQCTDRPRITKDTGTHDMCCATATDSDCVLAYPATNPPGATITSVFDSSCPQGGSTLRGAVYMPLGPTCGVPIMVSTDGALNGGTTTDSQAAGIDVNWGDGNDTTSLIGLGSRRSPKQATFLVEPPTTLPIFVTPQFEFRTCSGAATMSAAFDARPFFGTPILTGSVVSRLRVAADSVAVFVALADATALGNSTVRLLAGAYKGFKVRTGNTPITMPTWANTAAVDLSTSGVSATEPSIAVETFATAAQPTATPNVHVVWVEKGTTLMYARVSSTGAVSWRQSLAIDDVVSSPEIVLLDSQELGIVWTEQTAGGSKRVEFARVSASTGTPFSTTEIASPSGDALEPTITSLYDSTRTSIGIAWIDTRSGARQLFLQFATRGGVFSGSPVLVSIAAVQPEKPVLVTWGYGTFGAFWTDKRSGARAIYRNDNYTSGSFATSGAERQVSPPGQDAHDVRVPLKTPIIDPTYGPSRPADGTHPLVWQSGDSGNRARFVAESYTVPYQAGNKPFLLSCATDSGFPDLATFPDSTGTLLNRPDFQLGIWVESGSIMIQGVASFGVTR